jgi:hypothetical protein
MLADSGLSTLRDKIAEMPAELATAAVTVNDIGPGQAQKAPEPPCETNVDITRARYRLYVQPRGRRNRVNVRVRWANELALDTRRCQSFQQPDDLLRATIKVTPGFHVDSLQAFIHGASTSSQAQASMSRSERLRKTR